MALKGRLLTPEDYHFLLRARSLDDFVGYLTTTAYGPALSDFDVHAPEAESEFSRRLYRELAQDFQKIGRGLKKRERRFIETLAQRLAAENIKVVLRALHQALPPVAAVRLLIPLERLSPLDFSDLLNRGSISALVDDLASTLWGPPLARGLPRYLREGNLFPLEMSLDLWVFEYLWQALEQLSRMDRRLAGWLLGTLTDMANLIWAGRFREIYAFPGEEIYQYLIAAGSFREVRARRNLAFAQNLAAMVQHLPGRPYGELLRDADSLVEVEARLMRNWLKTLEKVLARPFFHIGLPIAYLFLKELEIRNVITLFTGIILRVPAERLKPRLMLRTAGESHV